ncbi:MAG: UDP-N-acetylmuramate--L-alanine ligase [Alphaproteobacteria bacterium]
MIKKQTKYFFCGLGGSGMSAIAQILNHQGFAVAGSDRSFDQGKSLQKFAALQAQGITLSPQDGSGIDKSVDVLVVSSAIEDSIPDVSAAKKQGIKIQKRAEVLAEIFNAADEGIAVGGTSGKSTVTGMIAHILAVLKKDPTVINGAVMLNAISDKTLGNILCGTGKPCVIEADESDGSIALYRPAVSVLNNITLDHKPLEELRSLFQDFIERASLGAVLNMDCAETRALFTKKDKKILSFGIEHEADLQAMDLTPRTDGIDFIVQDIPVSLQVAGRYNVLNALAAIAAVKHLGVSLEESATALKTFTGIERRMQTIGTKNGVTVIDDFAHNPDKIAASLAALKEHDGRLWVIFQPHGFAPTKLLKDGLIAAFSDHLDAEDCLIMPEIYYAGGTTTRDISSKDILQAVEASNKRVQFFDRRQEIPLFVSPIARAGDRIVVMGARDDTLTDFAKEILERVG